MLVEVYAHLIRHPTKGDYLIDTGLDKRFQHAPQGSYKGLIARYIVRQSFQEKGQDIASQLQQHNVDLQGVFLTHIHGDHTAGIPVLPENTPIVIGPNESMHHYPLIMYNDHFDRVTTLQEFDFTAAQPLDALGNVIDVFGDQSLWAIATPGHTRGNLSFLLHSTHGWVLLTGDASHTRWGFENEVIPGWAEDAEQAAISLDHLITFVRQNPEVKVVYGQER